MKNKINFLYVGLVVLLLVTGFIVYKAISGPGPQTAQNAIPTPISIPEVDSSVVVTLTKSTKPNSIDLTVSHLNKKYVTVGYEFSYDSKGLIKGVNSGSTPLDVSGKNEFFREVYLGTCSRNVCTPDVGVTSVSIALEFIDTSGSKSQFSKDYDL